MKSKTLQKLAEVIGTLPKDLDNVELSKLLGDVHWELESSGKIAASAKKNQSLIMDFFEDYQNLAIDAEYVLMDYIETPWWRFATKRSHMSKYIWLSNKRIALFQELLTKIKPGRLDEMLNN